MSKLLVAYESRTGNTEKMAEYIAEGIRMGGHEVIVKKLSELKKDEDLKGYEGYVLGCPTYHRDMTQGMKQFLFRMQRAGLEGKVGAAFGSYTHSGDAPAYIYETMEFVFKMDMSNLGSFNLKEHLIDSQDGMHACQDYGKGVTSKFPE